MDAIFRLLNINVPKDNMNELAIAVRAELIRVLDESKMTPNEISNYNMSRKAATGIFTIIMYKNTKAVKGEKTTATLELDSEVSTLVVAIGVLDEMIKEASNKHFLTKVAQNKPSPIIKHKGF